jgi:hypothetical protein
VGPFALVRYPCPFEGDLHTPRNACLSLRPHRTVIKSTFAQS